MRLPTTLFARLAATLLMALPACVTAQAALPTWEVLEFEEEAFWVTAQARLELPQPAPGATEWELRMEGSIQSSFERVGITFAPDDLRMSLRERLSKGREARLKTWNYQDDFILRKRQNPADNATLPPRDWPLTKVERMEYPPAATEVAVGSPYMLLLVADRLLREGMGATAEVLVQTDLNFYRARLRVGPGERLRTDYKLGNGRRVQGLRHTTAVSISLQPEGTLPEKDDFDLLGLHGDITIYFDRDSRLPLRLHGDAPHLGTTEIDLRAATLRPAST